MSELAWAAGLFDGEGSTDHTSRPAKRDYGRIRVTIGQDRDPEVLHRFAAAVGEGAVRGPYRYAYRGGVRVKYTYEVRGEAAVRVLQRLWPYLSGPKREQALRAAESYNASLEGRRAYRGSSRAPALLSG